MGLVDNSLLAAKQKQISNELVVINTQKNYIKTMNEVVESQKMLAAQIKQNLAASEMDLAISDFKSGADLRGMMDEQI
jgi:hypothetical protein